MRPVPTLLPLLLLCASWSNPQDKVLVLRAVRVVDVEQGRVGDPATLVLAAGRIAAIQALDAATPAGAEVVAGDGAFVLPGLIDLHTHLLLHAYDETSWNDQVLKESLELRTIRGVTHAQATLQAGFTTVRDLGTEGAGFADVALRDAIAQGLIPGPRVLTTTRALVATGCYGPAGFDPRWQVPKGAQEADGAEGVRKAVREQIAAGADWIKVYADYRRRPGVPATPTFTAAELGAAVDEARSAGLKVAAHATTDAAIARCVAAGVATIEHGDGVSEATLRAMQGKGVALVPTLAAVEAIARQGGWQPGTAEPERLRRAKAAVVLAVQVGVTVANGSDVGVFRHGDNLRELELLAGCGLGPAGAVRAATAAAAQVLGRQDLGKVAVGAVADLLVVASDPLLDLAVLRTPKVVVQGGRVVRPRP